MKTQGPAWRRDLARFAWTLWYHEPGQLLRRGAKVLGRRWQPTLPPEPVLEIRPVPSDVLEWIAESLPPGSTPTLDDLESRSLDLLQQRIPAGPDRILAGSPPPLWRFHWQYHEYLARLALRNTSPEADRTIGDWLLAWVEHFPAPTRENSADAWHPYVISRRIGPWGFLLATRPWTSEVVETLAQSLSRQAFWLERSFERDLGGNHLWENARALAIAGCIFQGEAAERWRRTGLHELHHAIEEQLLPSGEHFERSPMYQLDLARGLEELAGWLESVELGSADRIASVAANMRGMVDAIRHPDGGLPLLGDTTLDGDLPVPPPRNHEGWIGDYWITRRGEHFLLIDCGDMGPDQLPAHAHSDLLTLEVSLYGRRAIVDSGTFEYAGEQRSTFRSAAAHNVLTIDGEELGDVWSTFRMGRRGHMLARGSSREGEWTVVWGSHDAFRHVGVPRVTRLCVLSDSGIWWSLHFAVDWGGRDHEATEFIHWHPDCTIQPTSSLRGLQVHGLPGPVYWELASTAEPHLRSGRYSERFHVCKPSTVIELAQPWRELLLTAWVVHREATLISPSAHWTGDAIRLSWMDRTGPREIDVQVPFA